MSTLNDNLLQIYNTKLEIKDAIGTNSDVFAEYPDLIRGLKNGIVPTGTLSYVVPIDMYGPYVADVTSYSYVSVSLGESSAYIYANGQYTPADFGYAAINTNIIVNVPGPSGNKVISYNGNYDVISYASVSVNVESGGSDEPGVLVNGWSGDTVDASSADIVYEDIGNLLQEPLIDNRQCSIDSVNSLVGAEYCTAANANWHPSDNTVNIVIDEDASAGGYESSEGFLRITFDSEFVKNGFIRVKFNVTATNGYHTQESFDTNWITFEFYRGA